MTQAVRHAAARACLLAATIVAVAAGRPHAQTTAAPPASTTTTAPGAGTIAPGAITIEADKGIEWSRDAQTVTARGNAKAVRDTLQVTADVLRAHYRETPQGSSEVWRLDAEGSVEIRSPTETARGETGVYDLDKKLLVLSGGKNLELTTQTNRITAEKSLEYDTKRDVLIARGNAAVVDGDRTIYGDVITVYMRDAAPGQSRIERMDAEHAVRVVTPGETIKSQQASFVPDRDLATFNGAVTMQRGDSTISGCRGEVNLQTGVSKMFGCANGGEGDNRVRGVIMPQTLRQSR